MEGEEVRTCWVCLQDEEAFSKDKSPVNPFCHPCKCVHLDVHQLCLLRWIAEKEASNPGVPVRCPACLHVYQIEENVSVVELVVALFERANHSLVPYFSFSALAATVYVMSTAYGAYAMVVMCGPELADQILSDDGNWGSRAWVGMPLIPFALIASRLDIADNVLPILPFLILSNNFQPVPITFPPSPGVALCLLPWGRVIYKEAWRLIYHFSTSDDERAVAEQLRRQEQQNDPDIPFGVPLQLRARPPGAPRSIARLLFGALLLPAVASMAGAVLGMIPYVRAKIPNVFLRNVIGGSLVILGRDCILYWEFLKKRSRSFGMGRRVLDYIRG